MLALDEHLEAVRYEASGRLILIEGEVGIGKTRLVNEWLATLDDVQTLRSRCFEAEQSIPCQPWNDLLRTSMVPLAWGVNGVTSAIGSVGGIALAILWGFDTVLAAGGLLYLALALLAWRATA